MVLVDAAQSVPHLPLDVQALGADFVAFSGHKMLGPTGVGVLWGRRELLEAMPPFLGGGSMIRRVRLDGFEPAELPAKFEAGTPPIVSAIGLGAAIDYLNRIGLEAIQRARAACSLSRAHEVLVGRRRRAVSRSRAGAQGGHRQLHRRRHSRPRRGPTARSPRHRRSRRSSLRHAAAQAAGHTATSRASFYFYNTLAEVDALGDALRDAKRVFPTGLVRPNRGRKVLQHSRRLV